MISGTMPWASSALMTPTCANPRAAPPPSASAILGTAGGAADLSGKFAHADKRARSAIGVARSMGYPEGKRTETDGSLPETRPEREIVADSSPVPVRAGIFRLSSKKDRKFLRVRAAKCARFAACFGSLSGASRWDRSEEHTSELQSLAYLVCRLLLEKKKKEHHTDE